MMITENAAAGMFFVLPLFIQAQEIPSRLEPDTLKSHQIEKVEVSSKYYKRYNPKEMSEGLRWEVPLLNTPQNIQVLDGEIFRDQGISNLNESLTRNVSGYLTGRAT